MKNIGAQSGFGQARQPLVNPPTYIEGEGESQDQELETANASLGVLSWDDPSETAPKDRPRFVGFNDNPDLKNESGGDAKPENTAHLSPAAKTGLASPESDDRDGGVATDKNEEPDNASVLEERPTPITPIETKKDRLEETALSEEEDSVLEPTTPPAPEMLPDLTPYTHTIEQASALMKDRRCKYHSERKVQRLCQDGKIDCYRLKTSRNGTAVTEWLVNGSSLSRHIEKNEKKIQAGVTSLRPVATPTPNGGAKINSGDTNSKESEVKSADAINAVATPEQSGYANNDEEVEKTTDVISDLATPTESGDARIEKGEIASMMSEAKDPAPARGEQTFVQSTEVTALIEKAELLAKSEMKDEIISGLRKDKADLKELVEDHRANEKRLQQDLKDMATNAINQTLNTLQNIALGGKLTPNASATGQGDQSDHKLDNPQLRGKHDGV